MSETETFETIRYTADVVCVRVTGRGPELLTIRRGWPPHQGRLALPGGHVDPGETARAAAALAWQLRRPPRAPGTAPRRDRTGDSPS